MNQKVQDILKKINYIEADIEIQKQILFSIPSNDESEMEKVIKSISDKKQEISALRQEIELISPEEHQKIILLEKAVSTFQKIAKTRKIRFVEAMKVNENCALSLVEKTSIPCLVKACDEDGRWIIITLDGEIKEFSPEEVLEKPENTGNVIN